MAPKRIIIGITGTHGSGKGTAVLFLKNHGFKHFSAREFLLKEINKRGLPPDRTSMHAVSNELRMRFGSPYIVYSLYEEAAADAGNAVIESVYTVGEIEAVRKTSEDQRESFILLAIDADQRVRYKRISETRKSSTDNISFEEFSQLEAEEMKSTNPAQHNLVACRERADVVIYNNGTKEDFEKELKVHLAQYGI